MIDHQPGFVTLTGHALSQQTTQQTTQQTKSPTDEADGNARGAGFDLYPIVKARPLLTPPRMSQPADPPMFAYWCPHHRCIEILTEEITRWPAMVMCAGKPVILALGRAIFVGSHLLVPSKRDRLLAVLQNVYGQDVMLGSKRAWIDVAGVSSTWEPAGKETLAEFRRSNLFGRGKATVPGPELVA
jgi:hypothetical protein